MEIFFDLIAFKKKIIIITLSVWMIKQITFVENYDDLLKSKFLWVGFLFIVFSQKDNRSVLIADRCGRWPRWLDDWSYE